MDMFVNFIAGLSAICEKHPLIMFIFLLLTAIIGIYAAISICAEYSKHDDASDM